MFREEIVQLLSSDDKIFKAKYDCEEFTSVWIDILLVGALSENLNFIVRSR